METAKPVIINKTTSVPKKTFWQKNKGWIIAVVVIIIILAIVFGVLGGLGVLSNSSSSSPVPNPSPTQPVAPTDAQIEKMCDGKCEELTNVCSIIDVKWLSQNFFGITVVMNNRGSVSNSTFNITTSRSGDMYNPRFQMSGINRSSALSIPEDKYALFQVFVDQNYLIINSQIGRYTDKFIPEGTENREVIKLNNSTFSNTESFGTRINSSNIKYIMICGTNSLNC